MDTSGSYTDTQPDQPERHAYVLYVCPGGEGSGTDDMQMALVRWTAQKGYLPLGVYVDSDARVPPERRSALIRMIDDLLRQQRPPYVVLPSREDMPVSDPHWRDLACVLESLCEHVVFATGTDSRRG